MNEKPTLADFINLAISAESKARDFYKKLAEKFPVPFEVMDFWRGMMQDEEEHLKEVESMRDALTHAQLQTPKDPEFFHKVKEFLAFEVEEKLDAIRTLDDAYKMAVNLEYSEINKLMLLLSTDHVSLEEHKRKLRDSLDKHIEKIENFPRKFGDARWRKGIAPKSG
jgi:rubrerythrin